MSITHTARLVNIDYIANTILGIDYQLLHCIKSQGIAEGQGLNRFVDAIGCAEKLRQEDPEAFKIISSTPVKWENDYPHMTISPMVRRHPLLTLFRLS
jgi:hypothetical protein